MVDTALVDRFRNAAAAIGPGDRIGVAVSGGTDSLALLLLANAAFPGRILAISIDHGLRPAAADECAFVDDVCARLAVLHETVRVRIDPRRIGIQASARNARRAAWGSWAARHALHWVLTAHHAGDQAETVLMRLARGAGVGGLAGIPRRNRLSDTADLLRPLLGWTRVELAAIVSAAGLEPVVDPSNADPAFDRTRFRALLASTDLLDPHRLAAAADHARDADDAIAWIVQQLASHIRERDGEVELILRPWPREILRRLVLQALAALGRHPNDGPKVDRLIALLHAGRTATLAGIKAAPGADCWTFTPAPPRRAH